MYKATVGLAHKESVPPNEAWILTDIIPTDST
jgi:hypothetical protein